MFGPIFSSLLFVIFPPTWFSVKSLRLLFLDITIQMIINIYFCVNVFTFRVSRRGSCSIVIIFKSLFHFILFVLFFKKKIKIKNIVLSSIGVAF